MDNSVREAMQRILNYNWADERADYEDQREEDRNNHIFNDLVTVQEYLNGG